MNRTKTWLALLAVLVTAACSQQADQTTSQPETVELDTTEKRLSYGIAFGLGERLKADGVPLDVTAFNMGLRDAFEGGERLLSQEEIGREMQAYQASRQAERAAAAEQAATENTAAGSAFREANAAKEGVVTTESGLQYKVLRDGDGPKPLATDTVEVNYRGTLIDGTEFDSSYTRGSSVSFALNQVIPGWTEGLQLMPVGSKYELVIPPELAYGAGGAGQVIGPNATLVFEVELLQIAPREGDEAAEGDSSAAGES
jgi:FKBP-type peptidyl-prolyl cis-trans isomerase